MFKNAACIVSAECFNTLSIAANEAHTIFAVVVQCGEPIEGAKGVRRRLVVGDESDAMVDVTVFDALDALAPGTPLCLRNLRFEEYRGAFQAKCSSRDALLDVAAPDALVAWWRSKTEAEVARLGVEKTRAPKRAMHEGEECAAFQLTGTLIEVLDDPRATHVLRLLCCESCGRKLIGATEEARTSYCERCFADRRGAWRWLLHTVWADASGARRITFFDEGARALVGASAEGEWSREADGRALAERIRERGLRWHLSCTRREREHAGTVHEETACARAVPLDPRVDGRDALSQIFALM